MLGSQDDAAGYLCVACAWLAIGGAAGTWFGTQVGWVGLGAVLGGLLGPFGWLITLLVPPPEDFAAQRESRIAAHRKRIEEDGWKWRPGGSRETAQEQEARSDVEEEKFRAWARGQRPRNG